MAKKTNSIPAAKPKSMPKKANGTANGLKAKTKGKKGAC